MIAYLYRFSLYDQTASPFGLSSLPVITSLTVLSCCGSDLSFILSVLLTVYVSLSLVCSLLLLPLLLLPLLNVVFLLLLTILICFCLFFFCFFSLPFIKCILEIID